MMVRLSQAAMRLEVAYSSAYNLMLKGELDGEMIRGRWYVSRESLDRVELERRDQAGTKSRTTVAH